ncbi:restriction endonuclease subunit S [uncultured Polaribacter sp.]|uniref:restriction endonuclease subunit S n=1 Tax=uncultured Polaribacter sp. TaxID=174711 RepID=UPI0026200CA5|nr:restriction endonuclease subunit S [uncultured Polaribacter sp.]
MNNSQTNKTARTTDCFVPRNDKSNVIANKPNVIASEERTKQSVSLIPKLRFKEFEGDWLLDKMDNLTSYVDYRGKAPEKASKGIFLITAKNIKKGYIDYEKSKEYVPVQNYDLVMSKGKPEIGDILFTTEAPLGNIAQVDKQKIALAQRVIKLRGKEKIENLYLLHYMLSPVYQKLINRKAIGTTVQGISGKELRKTKVGFPTLKEQQKIATFLTAVDTKIQQLTKKKTLLEAYKKGAMQQIFPSANSGPKLRFKPDVIANDSEAISKLQNANSSFPDWEERRLGEIGEFKTSSVDKKIVQGQKIINLVNYMNVYRHEEILNKNLHNLMEVSANETQLKMSDLKKGDILFTPSSETPSDIGHSVVIFEDLKNTLYSYHLIRFRPKLKLDLMYSHYFCNTQNVLRQISRLATGSTRFTISVDSFSKIKVSLPSLKEQQKIANYLSAIDAKITTVQTQIEKTQTFKKGLLQQMFV